MNDQEKNEIIEDALNDADQSKVDACKELAEGFRDRIRGTNFEYDMLNGKRSADSKIAIPQDDDALIERCNDLERLLQLIWEDGCADYEDEKGKCSISSELIGRVKKLIEEC